MAFLKRSDTFSTVDIMTSCSTRSGNSTLCNLGKAIYSNLGVSIQPLEMTSWLQSLVVSHVFPKRSIIVPVIPVQWSQSRPQRRSQRSACAGCRRSYTSGTQGTQGTQGISQRRPILCQHPEAPKGRVIAIQGPFWRNQHIKNNMSSMFINFLYFSEVFNGIDGNCDEATINHTIVRWTNQTTRRTNTWSARREMQRMRRRRFCWGLRREYPLIGPSVLQE